MSIKYKILGCGDKKCTNCSQHNCPDKNAIAEYECKCSAFSNKIHVRATSILCLGLNDIMRIGLDDKYITRMKRV